MWGEIDEKGGGRKEHGEINIMSEQICILSVYNIQ